MDAANVEVFEGMTKLTTGFGNGQVVHVMVPNDRLISVERVA